MIVVGATRTLRHTRSQLRLHLLSPNIDTTPSDIGIAGRVDTSSIGTVERGRDNKGPTRSQPREGHSHWWHGFEETNESSRGLVCDWVTVNWVRLQ
jgi:hypothetical protein